jgi:hypothetical protein
MTQKSPAALFDEIEQFVADSRAILDSGAIIEMAGLDDQVRSLCETVLQLSQEDRIGDLTQLGEAMVAQRDQLAEEIRNLSTQKKAAHAYKIADSRDGFGQRDDNEESD